MSNPALTSLSRPAGVAFCGAGPGDPDLLTVRALRLIETADVIVHEAGVAHAILALAPGSTVLLSTGGTDASPPLRGFEIEALILHHAKAGRAVLRLVPGDVVLASQHSNEIAAVSAAGLDWQVAPGISPVAAAAAHIGKALAPVQGHAPVRLLDAATIDTLPEPAWAALAKAPAGVAVSLGTQPARQVQSRLLMHGADPDLPVSLVGLSPGAAPTAVASTLARLSTDAARLPRGGPLVALLGTAPWAARALPLEVAA